MSRHLRSSIFLNLAAVSFDELIIVIGGDGINLPVFEKHSFYRDRRLKLRDVLARSIE